MPEPSSADQEIAALAQRLQDLLAALGAGYWQSDDVQALQRQLRHAIGRYGAWSEDGLPLHQRARRASRYESEFAYLLWPGQGER